MVEVERELIEGVEEGYLERVIIQMCRTVSHCVVKNEVSSPNERAVRCVRMRYNEHHSSDVVLRF
jgi:hypothetical protein